MYDQLARSLADRYRIERELGAGGMATVYLAEDLKHKRRVALKVLKPELAAVLGAERFVQEIRTTAALQHPHILPLFDSGEADGFLYYVMPFIDGETLRAKLDRERQLAVADAIAITMTVAAALDLAHRHGVIHRDIKPENILLQDGVAFVTDFGIAVALRSSGGDRLTEPGLSIGTPAYMSPEQVTGERELDARTDVYALACVLYEMLAGDPPFVASNPQAVMAKHVMDVAPSIMTARPNATTALASALATALSKVPADRHDSAGQFAAALTASATSAEVTTKSVVVLPFVNQSADSANEYFVDGLTEEIITHLSRLRDLRVISRHSTMTLKGTAKNVPTIARELRVSHVVAGSVRRSNNALRVTAELVEASSDRHVWSDSYSGVVDDVFGIQEEIARKIVAGLEVTLTPKEDRQIAARPIDDVVAYDYYLRARQEFYAWTPGSLDRASALIDKALDIVADNPLLLATKGQLHWMYVNVSVHPDERYLALAEGFAERALVIDPNHYLGIFVRGLVAAFRGETARALEYVYRANELQPGDPNVRLELCRFSQAAGLRSYQRFVDEQIRLDPLMPVSWFGPAYTAHYNGRFDDAIPGAHRAMELAGPSSPLHIYSAWTLASAGLRDEARAVLERVASDLDGTVNGSWASFCLEALSGNEAHAVAHLTPELETAASFVDFFALTIAEASAILGRSDDAVRWARIATERGFINYPYLAEHSRFLAPIRDDPRYQSMLRNVKPRWEHVVAWERGRSA